MRVARVSVQKLFGLFDHDVPLNLEERVTLMHGPNGFGKTILLRMLDGIMKGHYGVFRRVPFAEFCVELDDGASVTMVREVGAAVPGQEDSEDEVKLEARWRGPGGEPDSADVPRRGFGARRSRLSHSALREFLPGYEQIDRGLWYDRKTRRRVPLEEVLASNPELEEFLGRPEPPWLRDLKAAVELHFIDTERLVTSTADRSSTGRDAKREPTVDVYSRGIVQTIGRNLADFASKSQSLDRTFPTRLLTRLRQGPTVPDTTELGGRLEEIKRKRIRLEGVGVFEHQLADPEISAETLNATESRVIELYCEDTEQKLAALDDVVDRTELLKRIINARFTFKKLDIVRDEGFVFQMPGTGQGRIQPSDLSSGEQHELVLWYRLLFDVAPGSLFLIDEPEISLHVGWQTKFLGDLEEVTRLSACDVLIATHSPQVVNDRWDVTVKLESPGGPGGGDGGSDGP